MLTIARARLSSDSTKLEDVKVLLSAEGIGGKMIQARDGTLLISSSIPAGVGILSADWPQPQQLDSLMGKVLRINTDGTVPKDNPFVGGRTRAARSSRSAFATIRGSRFTREPAASGPASTAPAVATRST